MPGAVFFWFWAGQKKKIGRGRELQVNSGPGMVFGSYFSGARAGRASLDKLTPRQTILKKNWTLNPTKLRPRNLGLANRVVEGK